MTEKGDVERVIDDMETVRPKDAVITEGRIIMWQNTLRAHVGSCVPREEVERIIEFHGPCLPGKEQFGIRNCTLMADLRALLSRHAKGGDSLKCACGFDYSKPDLTDSYNHERTCQQQAAPAPAERDPLELIPCHIRATHHYGFRCGEWALILGVVHAKGRPCYHVRFSDGREDFWVVKDESDPYEFSPGKRVGADEALAQRKSQPGVEEARAAFVEARKVAWEMAEQVCGSSDAWDTRVALKHLIGYVDALVALLDTKVVK